MAQRDETALSQHGAHVDRGHNCASEVEPSATDAEYFGNRMALGLFNLVLLDRKLALFLCQPVGQPIIRIIQWLRWRPHRARVVALAYALLQLVHALLQRLAARFLVALFRRLWRVSRVVDGLRDRAALRTQCQVLFIDFEDLVHLHHADDEAALDGHAAAAEPRA